MNLPTNAREALLAEALGDVARLLEQVQTVAPAIEEAQRSLLQARADLIQRAIAFEGQMAALTVAARTRAVEHIARHTAELSRRTVEGQTRAMSDAARQLFDAEVGPALQRLSGSLLQVVERVDRPWQRWSMHAATAATSSAITWAMALHLLQR